MASLGYIDKYRPESASAQQARWMRVATPPSVAAIPNTRDIDATQAQAEGERLLAGQQYSLAKRGREAELAQGERQLGISEGRLGLKKRELGEAARSFTANLGLDRAKLDFERSQNRFATGLGIAGIPVAIGGVAVGHMQTNKMVDMLERMKAGDAAAHDENLSILRSMMPYIVQSMGGY